MNKKSVIIIGAGVGGTAIAARLAKSGFDVTVLEKNDFGGGRCSLIVKDGHRFDQGPSLYLMPKMFEEFFAELDEDINDHLQLLRCDPNYKVHFDDGKHIQLSSHLPKLCSEIQRFEGTDEKSIQKFFAFMQESFHHYSVSVDLAMKKNYSNIIDLFVPMVKSFPELFRMHIFETIYGRICKYFSTEYLRRAFTFQTMYMGNSPFDAPGAYSLLQATEILEGIWYPKGGFYQVVRAIEKIAINKYGAKFKYNSGVLKINVNSNNEATGVTLEDGTVMKADLVVCNADLVYAYNKLLPPTDYGIKLGKNCELTSSTISFYWSLSKKVTQLDTHNIFLAKEYQKSFDQIFKEYGLPDEPSFYLNVPSRIDETAAPENKDTIVVLVPVGHMNTDVHQNYTEWIKKARNHVIETIEKRCGISDFRSLIENEIINEPRIWEQKFNLWKGSALGLSHNITQMLIFRPSTRSHIFKNMYFVGASTQPGTGVPIVLCGARLVSDQIVKDQSAQPFTSNTKNMFCLSFLLFIFSLLIFTVFQ